MNNNLKNNVLIGISSILAFSCNLDQGDSKTEKKRPNILIAISDDQSYLHTSFAGCGFINTPAFDRVAENGIYFTNGIAASPGCAPSRSALVTGRHHWQNEQSGQHAAGWMIEYVPMVDMFENAGYHAGATAKGVSPFMYGESIDNTILRKGDAAGKKYDKYKYEEGSPGDLRTGNKINTNNYYANFEFFMSEREEGKPFYFWFGCTEPHRAFEKDSWKKQGKKLADVKVPDFLPDNDIIRGDLLDYAVEIEWFDHHLAKMLNFLDSIGELENTIVIVTSDNGMAFPRAKANTYEYGIHVPFAISFPAKIPSGRVVDDPVGFADIAPTLFEMTKVPSEGMLPMSGKSISHILTSERSGIVDPSREYVFSGRERHSSSRWNNLGYPQRAARSKDFLFIWNLKPERWPAGAPQSYADAEKTALNPMYGIQPNGEHISDQAFTDIDGCPSKTFLVENHDKEDIKLYFELAVKLRPEFELFNIKEDPFCLNNLAGMSEYSDIEKKHKTALLDELERSNDPRILGADKDVFDSYPRYSPMRYFPSPNWVNQ
jgi:N-sulfoglucosamine sulfohydrolase